MHAPQRGGRPPMGCLMFALKGHRLGGLLANGWEFSGIFSAETGAPLTMLAGADRSGTALGRDRATVTSASVYGPGAGGTRAPCVDYLNTSAFQLPAIGAFGNLGKGRLRGPGTLSWDVGLFKNFRVTERWKVQLRAEFFNVLNRVNLNAPVSSVNSGGFGSIAGTGDPRIGQLALKVEF